MICFAFKKEDNSSWSMVDGGIKGGLLLIIFLARREVSPVVRDESLAS